MKTEEEKSREAENKLEEIRKRYIVGGQDELGHKITRIHVKDPNYVIYEIETDDISQSLRTNIYEDLCHIDAKTAEKYKELTTNFNQIYDEIVNIRGVLYKIPNASSIKAQTAGFISLALDKDNKERRDRCEEINQNCEECKSNVDCAEYKLIKLYEYINKRYAYQFKQKFNHLAIIGFISLALIILSVLAYYHCCCGIFDKIKDLIFVATAGSIGGFMSVSYGIKKINFFEKSNDQEELRKKKEVKSNEKVKKEKVGFIYFLLYGLERAFISIFSAVILYIAVKSNLIFDIANQINIWGLLIFGFTAAFSETFFPNVLKVVEKKGTQK